MEYTNCGKLGDVVDTRLNNIWNLMATVVAIISTIIGIATAEYGTIFNTLINFLGITALSGFVIIGFVTVVIIFSIFIYLYLNKCTESDAPERCATGVVNAIHGEDLGLFPFAADHPNIDLVVKSKYWSLIELGAVQNIFCSGANSPVLKVFYKSSKVCGAAVGAILGSLLGGAGGIIGGALAATAIGCATIWFCALAILILLLIVIVAALAGAWAGSAIGAAAADESAIEADGGGEIRVGTLLKASGPTAIHNEFEGAMVQYYNTDTELFDITSEVPPYSYLTPEREIPESFDCQI